LEAEDEADDEATTSGHRRLHVRTSAQLLLVPFRLQQAIDGRGTFYLSQHSRSRFITYSHEMMRFQLGMLGDAN
jgi:hypothetical protein